MVKSIAIIAGSYHKNHVVKMVEEARSVALDHGLIVEEVKWVPGSMRCHYRLNGYFLENQ